MQLLITSIATSMLDNLLTIVECRAKDFMKTNMPVVAQNRSTQNECQRPKKIFPKLFPVSSSKRVEYYSHVQNHWQIVQNVFWCIKELDPYEKVIAGYLGSYRRFDNGTFLSAKSISEATNIGETKVKEALHHLRDMGWIETVICHNAKGRITNVRFRVDLGLYEDGAFKGNKFVQGKPICHKESDFDDLLNIVSHNESEEVQSEPKKCPREDRPQDDLTHNNQKRIQEDTLQPQGGGRSRGDHIILDNIKKRVGGGGGDTANYDSNTRTALSAPNNTHPPTPFKIIESKDTPNQIDHHVIATTNPPPEFFKTNTEEKNPTINAALKLLEEKERVAIEGHMAQMRDQMADRAMLESLGSKDASYMAWAFKKVLQKELRCKEKKSQFSFYALLKKILQEDKWKFDKGESYQDSATRTKTGQKSIKVRLLTDYPLRFNEWAFKAESERYKLGCYNLEHYECPNELDALHEKWRRLHKCRQCREGWVFVKNTDGHTDTYRCTCPLGDRHPALPLYRQRFDALTTGSVSPPKNHPTNVPGTKFQQLEFSALSNNSSCIPPVPD